MRLRADKLTGLTAREAAFAREYLVDQNGTRAAGRAGYKGSDKVLVSTATTLLAKPLVAAAVRREMDARAARVLVKADDVLRTLKQIMLVDLAQAFDSQGVLIPIREMSEDLRRAISSYEVTKDGQVKVKFWDKVKCSELLGRHLKLLGNEDQDREPIEVVVRLERAQ